VPKKLSDYSNQFLPKVKPKDFTHEALAGLLKSYAKLLLGLDGMWYRRVKERIADEVLACDIQVWQDFVKFEVATIKRQMKIRGNDITALMKVMQLTPWFQLTESNIVLESNRRAMLTVTYCATLDALENKSERPGYESCTVVCRNIRKSVAYLLNPNIQVECLKSPPRKSKDDICCQWEFSLGK
jgi:hypothetical protein